MEKLIDYFGKMENLPDTPLVKKATTNIVDAVEEMLKKGDRKNYYFWKEIAINEFNNIIAILNKDVLDEGRKLYRSRIEIESKKED